MCSGRRERGSIPVEVWLWVNWKESSSNLNAQDTHLALYKNGNKYKD